MEGTVGTCLLAVGAFSPLHHREGLQVFIIVRLHGYGPLDMLQGGGSVAQAVICQGAEIIPPSILLTGVIESIECLCVPPEADVLGSCLLVAVTGFLLLLPLVLLPGTSKGIVAIAAAA